MSLATVTRYELGWLVTCFIGLVLFRMRAALDFRDRSQLPIRCLLFEFRRMEQMLERGLDRYRRDS